VGLIDIRWLGDEPEVAVLDHTDLMCPGSMDVCCRDADFISPAEEAAALAAQSTSQQSEEEEDSSEESEESEEDLFANLNLDDSSEESEENEEEKSGKGNLYEEPEVNYYDYGYDMVGKVPLETGEDSSEEENETAGGYGGEQTEEEEKESLKGSAGDISSESGEEEEGESPSEQLAPIEKTDESFQAECGRRNQWGVGLRIQGFTDDESQFGEWPHMCAVLSREIEDGFELLVFVGGASLVAPGAVLTAAHKVAGTDPSQLVVRCGEWDTQTEGEPLLHQDRLVSSLSLHPEFHPRTVAHSVAVLFLETEFQLAQHIDTVCRPGPTQVFHNNTDCYVKGWGRDKFGPEAEHQAVLKELRLPLVPRTDCQTALRGTRLGRRFRLDPSHICAGGEAGQDACRGDGGGPLVCSDPVSQRYTQVRSHHSV